MEGNWESAFLRFFHRYMYHKVQKLGLWCFLMQNFETHRFVSFSDPASTLSSSIVWKTQTRSFNRDSFTPKIISQSECPEESKSLWCTLRKKACGLKFIIADLGHVSGSNVGKNLGRMLERTRHQQPEFACNIVCMRSLTLDKLTWLDAVSFICDTETSFRRTLFFCFDPESLGEFCNWQTLNYQTFRKLQDKPVFKTFRASMPWFE